MTGRSASAHLYGTSTARNTACKSGCQPRRSLSTSSVVPATFQPSTFQSSRSCNATILSRLPPRSGHVVHYPLRGGSLLNIVALQERDDWKVEGWNVAGTTEEVLNDLRGWHPDLHAVFRAVDVPYKWALALRPVMDAWTKGRCTLLGDACHPMVPFLAQGAVMALEDGLVLARAIEAYGAQPEALTRYEVARRERANKVVEGSAAMIPRFHNRAMV